MDVVGHVRTVMGAIQYPINMIKEDRLLSSKLKNELRSIKEELDTINRDVEKYDELRLQDLAYDIEDFTEGLWAPGGAIGPVLSAIGMNPKDEHVQLVNHFKERIQKLEKRQEKSPQSGSSSTSSLADGSPCTPKDGLVGIDKPTKELLELLSPLPAEEKQMRVISIVGCRGIGKTALARAVLEDSNVSHHFDCVAWVVASECSHSNELIDKVFKTIGTEAGDTTSANLHDILEHKRYLVFIDDVQAPADGWKDTVDAFPDNRNSSRIIMTTSVHSVATACSSGSYVYTMLCLDQHDSKELFWRKVYGHDMKPAEALVMGSETIFSKCDGLPLALISVAKHLSAKGGRRREHLDSTDCEKAGQTVSTGEMKRALVQCYDSLPDYDHKTCLLYLSMFPRGHQIKSKNLLRRLIAEGLTAKDSHTCFEELIDRCLVEPVHICSNSRDVKRCQVHGVMLEFIIQQAVSKNLVTLCHKHGTLPVDSSVLPVRRLSIQSDIPKDIRAEDNSTIRSLTMFRSGLFKFTNCNMLRLLDLEGCKELDERSLGGICELQFLRYLSLRKTNVTKLPRHIEKLQRLETLDMRDTDLTVSPYLPIGVIMLPKLAYVFGKFNLPDVPRDTHKLKEFLSNRSRLHTLAGFVINGNQGIEDIVLLHARYLKKVKVWYAPISRSSGSPTLNKSAFASDPAPKKGYSLMHFFSCFPKVKNPVPSADPNPPTLDEYQQSKNTASTTTSHAPPPARSSTSVPAPIAPTTNVPLQINNNDLISTLKARFSALESVSIDSNQICGDFLVSLLKDHSTISSVKLQGRLQSLPDSSVLEQVPRRNNFKRLQLSSTGLRSENLSALQSLRCLEYLKLVEDPDGFQGSDFIVRRDGFPSLKRLCFQAPKLPKLQFEDGAMTSLVSLQLLCPDSSQLQLRAETIGGISHAANLNEVVLHHSATKAAQDHWKKAIQAHHNRPCVKKQPESETNTAA